MIHLLGLVNKGLIYIKDDLSTSLMVYIRDYLKALSLKWVKLILTLKKKVTDFLFEKEFDVLNQYGNRSNAHGWKTDIRLI